MFVFNNSPARFRKYTARAASFRPWRRSRTQSKSSRSSNCTNSQVRHSRSGCPSTAHKPASSFVETMAPPWLAPSSAETATAPMNLDVVAVRSKIFAASVDPLRLIKAELLWCAGRGDPRKAQALDRATYISSWRLHSPQLKRVWPRTSRYWRRMFETSSRK